MNVSAGETGLTELTNLSNMIYKEDRIPEQGCVASHRGQCDQQLKICKQHGNNCKIRDRAAASDGHGGTRKQN